MKERWEHFVIFNIPDDILQHFVSYIMYKSKLLLIKSFPFVKKQKQNSLLHILFTVSYNKLHFNIHNRKLQILSTNKEALSCANWRKFTVKQNHSQNQSLAVLLCGLWLSYSILMLHWPTPRFYTLSQWSLCIVWETLGCHNLSL